MEQLTLGPEPNLREFSRHIHYFCMSCGASPEHNGGDSPLFFHDNVIVRYGDDMARVISVPEHARDEAVYCEHCGFDGDF